MKVENHKNSKHKKFNVISMFFVLSFCLMLLPFEQLLFIEGQVFADSNDLIDYGIGADERINNVTENSDIKRTLWQMSITSAIDDRDKKQKNELQTLIDQINSIELSLAGINETENSYEAASSVKPERKVMQNEDTQPAIKNDNIGNNNLELVTWETIQKIKKLAENPNEVDNPYEIGNTLYLSNNIGEAAVFYQEALKRKKPEDMSSSEDRAWLLFQTGNSLRTIDMLAAADMYGKLITEYPDSAWAGYARVQRNVITWYLSDKPDDMLKQIKK
jgi:hypothetical protein